MRRTLTSPARGGMADLGARWWIRMPVVEDLARELQMVDELAYLHQNKGSVRLI
jgi:hypothetical protein